MSTNFKIINKSQKSRARIGAICTPHGNIKTPAFIPVATQAAIKGLTLAQLEEIGIEALLCNTYHLYLRPGDNFIKNHGGLHQFMGWDRPIFTDSGGFQAFSLGLALEHGVGKIASIFPEGQKPKKRGKSFVKITEDGVKFRSHLDGSPHLLTPEKSVAIQQNLGADIIFAFDECTSPLSSYTYTKEAMVRTHRWAERCLKAFDRKKNQQLFGIIQGGQYQDLREESAKFINNLTFAGFGIGGSLGGSKSDMYQVLDWVLPLLDERKPKHLLGIGSVEDIKEAVKKGVDIFDCVLPTRLARNGSLLTNKGKINIKASRYLKDKKPIEKNCSCYACRHFSRSYICHLLRAGEMLGATLATIHNLAFMDNYMKAIRQKIKNGNL